MGSYYLQFNVVFNMFYQIRESLSALFLTRLGNKSSYRATLDLRPSTGLCPQLEVYKYICGTYGPNKVAIEFII